MSALAGVTGVTGLLGANLAKALLEAGHRVRARRRRSSRADHLRDLAVEWVDADLGDTAGLTRAFHGCDYILGGENLTYKQAFERIAAVAGIEPPRWPVPRPLASVLGWFGDASERLTSREPLINTVTVG